MARCENCNADGIDPRSIIVGQRGDKYLLVGPCCYLPIEKPKQDQGPNYGFEISSNYGVLAYVEYEGFTVEFRKTPEQMKQIYSKYFHGEA